MHWIIVASPQLSGSAKQPHRRRRQPPGKVPHLGWDFQRHSYWCQRLQCWSFGSPGCFPGSLIHGKSAKNLRCILMYLDDVAWRLAWLIFCGTMWDCQTPQATFVNPPQLEKGINYDKLLLYGSSPSFSLADRHVVVVNRSTLIVIEEQGMKTWWIQAAKPWTLAFERKIIMKLR